MTLTCPAVTVGVVVVLGGRGNAFGIGALVGEGFQKAVATCVSQNLGWGGGCQALLALCVMQLSVPLPAQHHASCILFSSVCCSLGEL